MRGSPRYFEALGRAVEARFEAVEARVNPTTGSVLLEGAIDEGELTRTADAEGWFTVTGSALRAPAAGRSLSRVEPRHLAIAGFLGLAAVQAARGQLLAPSVSLVWYALEMWRGDASGA